MKSLWSLDDQEEVRVHLAHSFLKISQARERERQRDAFSRRGVTGYSELVSYTWLVLVSTPDLLRALLPSNRRQPGLDCSSTFHDGAASLSLRLCQSCLSSFLLFLFLCPPLLLPTQGSRLKLLCPESWNTYRERERNGNRMSRFKTFYFIWFDYIYIYFCFIYLFCMASVAVNNGTNTQL